MASLKESRKQNTCVAKKLVKMVITVLLVVDGIHELVSSSLTGIVMPTVCLLYLIQQKCCRD